MNVALSLIERFKTDLRIRAVFEAYEIEKKIKTNQQQSKKENILESDSFVPNIKRRIEKVDGIRGGSKIQHFINFWEYLIDQHVPTSDKRKKQLVPKVEIQPNKEHITQYITVNQLQNIHDDFKLIQKVRDQKKQKQLIVAGLPILKISQGCLQIYKKEGAVQKIKTLNKQRINGLVSFCKNPEFHSTIKSISSYLTGGTQP